MARQSQLNDELIRQIIAAQGVNPVQAPDQNVPIQGTIRGLELADTIEKRKQAQEDRIKALAKEIETAKRQRTLSAAVKKQKGEVPGLAALETPAEGAKQILEQAYAIPKTGDARPDNIKQLLQVGDKTMAVTYGGEVKQIDIGGRAQPLVQPQLPAEQAKGLAELGQVAKKLARAKEIFDKTAIRDKAGNVIESPLVGIADNLANRAQEFVGKPEAETTEFRTLVTNNINQQIKAITGAQLSEAEAQRIMKALPSLNLKEAAFEQRLKDAIKITEDIIKEKQAAFQGFSGVPNTLSNQTGGLSPEKAARLAELRAKKAAGTLR